MDPGILMFLIQSIMLTLETLKILIIFMMCSWFTKMMQKLFTQFLKKPIMQLALKMDHIKIQNLEK